ncbi:MAG TPA: sigma-70 family RNA polymerase sigma factor [Pyrinomonadaceae bacterium]
MSSDSNKGPDGDFCKLLSDIRSGLKPIDDLFKDPLFERQLRIMIAAHQRTPADAEELANDVRVKVWRSFPGFEGDYTKDYGNFFAWLRSIVRTSFLDTLKKGLVYGGERPEDLTSGKLNSKADSEFRDATLEKEFQECISSLPKREGMAVTCFLQGMTSREAAEVLTAAGFECTHVTALNWVRDALRAYFPHPKQDVARKISKVAPKRNAEASPSAKKDRKKKAV